MNHKTLINIIICLSIAVPCLPQITNGSSSFVINEIQTANIDQYIDYSNNYGGWIEIYNPTSSAITLDNYYISNDANNLRLHKLQNLGNIARQKFCIIYFDHNSADGNFSSTANKQVRFKLNADGAWADKLEYISHTGEETVGRYPDGGRRIYKMSHPTIAASNILTNYSEWLSGEDVNFYVDTSISETETSDKTVNGSVKTEYFTVNGIRLNTPQRGINILRLTNADGRVITRRIIVK